MRVQNSGYTHILTRSLQELLGIHDILRAVNVELVSTA